LSQPSPRQLIRGLVIGLLLALVVLMVFTLIGDVRSLSEALSHFNWILVIPIFALTMWNYWWRFLKWELYLESLDVPHIPRRLGMPIYLSGFSMSVTPGKVGEIIKAFEVRSATGAPVERTSSAIVAERVTDALAMILLAIIGVTQFSYGRVFVGALIVVTAVGLILIRQPGAVDFIVRLLSRLPFADRFIHLAETFFTSLTQLLSPRLLAIGTGLGIVSWLGECIAFFLVLIGLGLEATWSLLLVATFVLAVSSLAGGISMLPGGLGVADASGAAMLLHLIDDPKMTESTAIAATLLIRFATLWFSVLLGAAMLIYLRRRRITPGQLMSQPISISNGEQA
jgi:uncharacterized protein (TIRG00374 family)